MVTLRKEVEWDGTIKVHSKASERYVEVTMTFETEKWTGWIPIEYRRKGLNLSTTEEIYEYLNQMYDELDPSLHEMWKKEQEDFWKSKRAATTQRVFDTLVIGQWVCVECNIENRNWARRNQDLKEYGYTISTNLNRACPTCQKNGTHLMLLPLKREHVEKDRYEVISPKLRKRILKTLNNYNVYEAKKQTAHLLPDHKFPEIRWDHETPEDNPEQMTEEMIRQKFQLLDNQRNLHKREVCRACYQTGERGIIYGIPFFYKGERQWDETIPSVGKEAEAGCVGCGWYDIDAWRNALIDHLKK